MSYTTITQATEDPALRNRVLAAAGKEAWASVIYGQTPTGKKIREDGPFASLNYFIWPTAVDTEAAYAYAVETGNPNPGGDRGVISDADIQAAIQAHWPDPIIPPP